MKLSTNLITKLCSALFMLLVLVNTATAQDKDERRGPPRQPPQEAIDACVNQSENDEVTFAGRDGEDLDATCVYVEDQLVAVPKNHRR